MWHSQLDRAHQARDRVRATVRSHPWVTAAVAAGFTILVIIAYWANNPHAPLGHVGGVGASSMSAFHGTSGGAANGLTAAQSAAAADGTTTSAAAAAASPSTGSSSAPATGRKVIEQATLSITLSQVQSAANRLDAMARAKGGFVESMQWSDDKSRTNVEMTIRVPETEFSAFVDSAKVLGTVTAFSQTGRDVTDQYNNLQQSIAQLQGQADAYTRLYNRAQSMQDMLQIQQALSGVNAQIANLNQELHGLNRSVDLATLSLNLSANAPVVSAPAHTTPIVDALVASWHVLVRSLYALVTVIAWLLPWGAITAAGTLVWRFWSRRRKKKQTG